MIIAAVIFALLLGAFIFVVLPHASVSRRAISVSIFLALIVIVYGGAAELLGRPKPLRLEWRDSAKAQVLAALPETWANSPSRDRSPLRKCLASC
jgi:hypothetical protein